MPWRRQEPFTCGANYHLAGKSLVCETIHTWQWRVRSLQRIASVKETFWPPAVYLFQIFKFGGVILYLSDRLLSVKVAPFDCQLSILPEIKLRGVVGAGARGGGGGPPFRTVGYEHGNNRWVCNQPLTLAYVIH